MAEQVRLFLRDDDPDDDGIWVINAGHLQDIIEKHEAKPPKDKRSVLYKAWLNKLNLLYNTYNDMVGFNAYPRTKMRPS